MEDLLSLQSGNSDLPESYNRLDVEHVFTGLCEGERDYNLFRYACLLQAQDIPIGLAIGFVSEAAARCIPPFEADIAEQKVMYAYSKYRSPKDRMQEITDQLMKKKGIHKDGK